MMFYVFNWCNFIDLRATRTNHTIFRITLVRDIQDHTIFRITLVRDIQA